MAVKLRGQDDYYAQVVEIDGSTFWIADLSDDEFEEFLRKSAEVRKGTEFDPAALSNPKKLVAAQIAFLSNVPKQQEARRGLRDLIHWVLARGLVRWDLPVGEDGGRPDGTLLPAAVKSKLAVAILKASELTMEDATFPAGVGAGAPV